jgi:molybdenum cofactor guanylyltransferase
MQPSGGDILGVILAGGRSRRFGGGDKFLRLLAGRPLLDHVIGRVRPQVTRLILNANGDADRFASFGLPVVPDVVEGFAGPMAGLLTAMDWAADHAPLVSWVASFPADAPFVPEDLVERLYAALDGQQARLACARSGERDHPVLGLWPMNLRRDLRKALVEDDVRAVYRWMGGYPVARVTFDDTIFDPLFNVNHPDDLAKAERVLAAGPKVR